MANDSDNSSSFDDLVSSMSSSEREEMLTNINKKKTEEEHGGGVGTAGDNSKDEAASLMQKLEQATIFQKIYFWFKSLFSGSSMEQVFNEYLVSKIAGNVERDFRGIIDYKNGVFLQEMYTKLQSLMQTREFFAPYVSAYEDNKEMFEILLGRIVMPEIHNQIESESDPHQYPLNKEVNSEMRSSLIHKIESIENSLPSNYRATMYAAVRSMEWLAHISRLPVERVLSKFQMNSSGQRTCAFSSVASDIVQFARVFVEPKYVTEELLHVMYLFANGSSIDNIQGDVFEANKNDFYAAATNQVAMITAFHQTVPCPSLAKIVLTNSMYTVEELSGGEDWLIKYKSRQKVIFDRRWEQWIYESKKERLKEKIIRYYTIATFPKFPYRPWEEFGDTHKFKMELTLGFLYYFMNTLFPQYLQPMKTVSVEGDFSVKENRVEFSNMLLEMVKVTEELDNLCRLLGENGEYGKAFARISNEKDTKGKMEELEVLLNEVKRFVMSVMNSFCKSTRSIINLMSGIFSEKTSQYYGPVTNLMKIGGADNKLFKDNLYAAKEGYEHALEILSEMEILDQDAK